MNKPAFAYSARNIKKMRATLGLSQTEFAERLRIGLATVQRWEAGVQEPSSMALEKLEALARELELV